jgi:hypothetical protein
MGRCLLAYLAAALVPLASGASIRGVVLEAVTGNPLAHVRVDVTPVEGTQGKAVTVRVDHSGSFDINNLAPGLYTATAAREGFITAEYGQKRWNAAGMPFPIDDSHPGFLDFRLQHFGAITGVVVDEQDVGILGLEVVAYKAGDPQVPVGLGATDDRGIYRIAGLEPGIYLVRNKPKQIEDVGYLPTFGREATFSSGADRAAADLDRTSEAAFIRPKQGNLLPVAGQIFGAPPFQVTFVSEMGRQTIQSGGTFRFDPVPPGHYEIYATGPGDNHTYTEGAYMPLEIKDDKPILIKMYPMRDTSLRILDQRGMPIRGPGAAAQSDSAARGTQQPGGAPTRAGRGRGSQTDQDTPGVVVLGRRIDLAGVGKPETFKVRGNGTARLAPGRWELRCLPPDGYFVTDYNGTRQKFGARERPDGWHEITVEGYASATFILSLNPATIRGVVRSYGDAIAGAPVFLEPYDNAKHERLWEITTVRSDYSGHYTIANLAPGAYRILSTFEFRLPTVEDFDGAAARVIIVDQSRETVLDLDMWGIR